MPASFSTSDLRQLAERGISAAEAERQLELLAHPPAPAVLERPCTLGDGIVGVGPEEGRELLALHADAADRGRVRAFVPASGAASRMFRDLIAARDDAALRTGAGLDAAVQAGRPEAQALREFLRGIDRFAFFGELKAIAERRGAPLRTLVREGPFDSILGALLDDDGLGFATVPKGLVTFHDYPEGPRTPLDEHLVEVTQFAADTENRCRLHFTVSPEHRARFETRLAEATARMGERLSVSYDATLSEQHPSSDTLAADLDGAPFRDRDGRLLFRPAGHGALIANLAEMDADLVMIKNVDNVAHDRFKHDTFIWSRLLVGLATRLEYAAVALFKRLEKEADESALANSLKFLADTFHRVPIEPAVGNGAMPGGARVAATSGTRAELVEWTQTQLARPIRVCGMVHNTGEPGGGPMWVRGRDGGVTPQIVELSQVDLTDARQQAIAGASTHFNPVFMALALRGADNHAHRLADFVDERAVLVVRRSAEGRDLLALERPGLWNGAMAGWNTVFVEVPLGVFNPVKTVNDLLRKEHQPG